VFEEGPSRGGGGLPRDDAGEVARSAEINLKSAPLDVCRGIAVQIGRIEPFHFRSRARFCVSAGHSRADLEDALLKIKEVAALIKIRYAVSPFG